MSAVAAPETLSPALGHIFISTPLTEQVFQSPATIGLLGIAVKLTPCGAPNLGNDPTPVQCQEAAEFRRHTKSTSASTSWRRRFAPPFSVTGDIANVEEVG